MDEIRFWLFDAIYSVFSSNELHAWIFGSLVSGCSPPNDCDVLIFIDEKCVSRLAQISPIWRQEFELMFNLPLHLTRLTFSEAKSAGIFTEAIFGKSVIRLHP